MGVDVITSSMTKADVTKERSHPSEGVEADASLVHSPVTGLHD